jgi:hypothetical protein
MAAWMAKTALTVLLCAVSYWMWSSGPSAAEWLGLGYLDLVARALVIFLALSLADVLLERLPESLKTSQSEATHDE